MGVSLVILNIFYYDVVIWLVVFIDFVFCSVCVLVLGNVVEGE